MPNHYAGILARLLSVATGRIQNYAPDAADADANEAATRFVGYCLRPAYRRARANNLQIVFGIAGHKLPWLNRMT